MDALLDEALAVWRACLETLPALGPGLSAEEQGERETEYDRFYSRVQAELPRTPVTREERAAVHGRITAAFAEFARRGLRFDEAQVAVLLDGGLASAGTQLARQARAFDESVGIPDILQATRNAWTACGLQALAGRTMRLSPAVFAYSMLYPYTDNYMDAPEVSGEVKRGFSARFGERLRGQSVAAANAHEERIWRLVGLIESEYGRAEFPQVWASLLGIHGAQENSLRLRTQTGEADVLRLSFAKGGASVMADVYLALGRPTEAEARFGFYWGVVLQLADDLQDVAEDRRDGVRTVFTEAAARGTLDALTSRALWFAGRVMGMLGGEDSAVRQVIRRSSVSVFVEAAGQLAACYSPEYLADLERHSPFRFGFLAERRRRMGKHRGVMARLFEAFLAGDDDEPAFPLVPGLGISTQRR